MRAAGRQARAVNRTWVTACTAAASVIAAASLLVGWRARTKALRTQARQDSLTGLANRARLDDRLSVALERSGNNGRYTGVLFCDLDNFKRVNDTYGHAVGDVVLTAVAMRLLRSVRATDVVARFGGDEFVVVCCDLTEPSEVEDVRRRITAEMAQPFLVGDEPCGLSLSIGSATSAGDETSAADLVAAADRAMFAHKRTTTSPL